MHFHFFVGDFGNADRFRDFGTNTGSRPYMAAEQYSKAPLDLAAYVSFDVFSLGVVAFECFTDGVHPIGETTSDVFPWVRGILTKWNKEKVWRDWAQTLEKSLPEARARIPVGMEDLILASLSADPSKRPSLENFENRLWSAFDQLDTEARANFRLQINDLESRTSTDSKWDHMDDRLNELRQFYSSL